MATGDTVFINSATYLSCHTLHDAVNWLIFTRPVRGQPQELEIGATEGVNRIFRGRFTWDKIKSIIGERSSNDVVLARFKDAFQKSRLRLRVMGVKLQAMITPDDRCIFEMYEIPAADVKVELQSLLFGLAERCMDLRSDLQLAKGGDEPGISGNDEEKRKDSPPKRPKHDYSKTSALNPGSRRRKPATGFDYD